MSAQDQLAIIADYADRVAASNKATDAAYREFMALHELYESRAWVAEWLEQSPEPKRHANNWKPDSKSRFSGWLRWKLAETGRNGEALGFDYTYKLLAAGQVVAAVPTLDSCLKLTESSLRPFRWVLTNRYENRLPEIVAAAIEQAGSVESLTNRHAREAVNGWRRSTFSTRRDGTPRKTVGAINRAAAAAGKAHAIRMKMLDEIAEMYKLAGLNPKALDEFNGLLHDLETFLNEKRVEVGAA